MPIPSPEWREQFIAEHGYGPTDWDEELYERQAQIQQAWQQKHGFTPINWESLTQAYGMEGARSRAESRSFNWSNVDLPYTLPHIWRPGGGGGGDGGAWAAQEAARRAAWQGDYGRLQTTRQNFLNALAGGKFFAPSQIAGFGENNWWMQQQWQPGTEPTEAQAGLYGQAVPVTQEITPGSWLWNLPEGYRQMYTQTTPELQQIGRAHV